MAVNACLCLIFLMNFLFCFIFVTYETIGFIDVVDFLVKILEMVALVIDGVLIVKEGYALACPISTLIVIIYIGLNRERHLLRMKEDLQKVFAAKQK